MARTVETIKRQMTTELLSHSVIREKYKIAPSVPNDGFESVFSKVSIESILFYIIAFAIHILERIFDTEKESLTQYAESLRPHTKQWYINTIKAFQLGDSINNDTGKYDVVDETKQIIKYCSLRVKNDMLYFLIATDNNGAPQKISNSSIITSIWNYCDRVFDAGVHFNIFSNDADVYKCKLLINYDPLVLNNDGKRLDGGNDTPVLDAINGYFRSFPFDSEFSNMALVDAIQQVDGVRVVELTESMAKPNIAGSSFQAIVSTYIANSGYMLFNVSQSQITYKI